MNGLLGSLTSSYPDLASRLIEYGLQGVSVAFLQQAVEGVGRSTPYTLANTLYIPAGLVNAFSAGVPGSGVILAAMLTAGITELIEYLNNLERTLKDSNKVHLQR